MIEFLEFPERFTLSKQGLEALGVVVLRSHRLESLKGSEELLPKIVSESIEKLLCWTFPVRSLKDEHSTSIPGTPKRANQRQRALPLRVAQPMC